MNYIITTPDEFKIYVTEVKELTNGHQENNNTTSLVT